MKIKVGEYVRTKDGVIAKLERIEEEYYFDNYIYREFEDDINYLFVEQLPEYIIKHSSNIIDLIEPGDVIKYKEMFETKANEPHILNLRNQKEVDKFKKCVEDKLVAYISVVTHEQFKEMEYKV